MTDERTNQSRSIQKQIIEKYGQHFPVFSKSIPRRVAISEASSVGQSIFTYDAKNDGALAYSTLAREVEHNAKKTLKRSADTRSQSR